MASWIEIERVRKDPRTFRLLAKHLIADPNCEEAKFVDGFLENIAHWKRDEISLRQCEILLELRDSAEIHFRYRGLNISVLIIKCYEGRSTLEDPADGRRIENLYESGRSYVTGAQMGWFKRICKELGEMEDYM